MSPYDVLQAPEYTTPPAWAAVGYAAAPALLIFSVTSLLVRRRHKKTGKTLKTVSVPAVVVAGASAAALSFSMILMSTVHYNDIQRSNDFEEAALGQLIQDYRILNAESVSNWGNGSWSDRAAVRSLRAPAEVDVILESGQRHRYEVMMVDQSVQLVLSQDHGPSPDPDELLRDEHP